MVAEIAQSGTLLLGSSRQLNGFDTRVDPHVVDAIARRATRFFPALRGMKAVRRLSPACGRSVPDHLPLIGPLEIEGLFVASGHEGAGICESSATGLLISQSVAEQAAGAALAWVTLAASTDRRGVAKRCSQGRP